MFVLMCTHIGIVSEHILLESKSRIENMSDKLAEVEISKDGETYYARITLTSGEVVSLENDDFEEVLEQVANDLQDRFGT